MAEHINLSSKQQVLYRSPFVEKEARSAQFHLKQQLDRKALGSKQKWSISSLEEYKLNVESYR